MKTFEKEPSGITLLFSEYHFGNYKLISNRKKDAQTLSKLIERFRQLTYSTYLYAKFRKLNSGVATYVTSPSRDLWKADGKEAFADHFSDQVLINHLQGKHAIAIRLSDYSQNEKQCVTNFIVFDLDIKQENDCLRAARALHHVLKELGIQAHISLSGGKGLHFEIYLDDFVSIPDAEAFCKFVIKNPLITNSFEKHAAVLDEQGNHLRDQNGELRYKKHADIEYRPMGKTCIKLPLGVHPKTGCACFYVEFIQDQLVSVKDNYDYFINRTPHNVDACTIVEIAAQYEMDIEPTIKYQTSQKRVIEKQNLQETQQMKIKQRELNQMNLVESATDLEITTFELGSNCLDEIVGYVLQGHLRPGYKRHDSLLWLASYFKARKLPNNEIIDRLKQWSVKLFHHHDDEFQAELYEHLNEIQGVVKTASPMILQTNLFYISKRSAIAWFRACEHNFTRFRFLLACKYILIRKGFGINQLSIAWEYFTSFGFSDQTIVKYRKEFINRGWLIELKKHERKKIVNKQTGEISYSFNPAEYQLNIEIEQGDLLIFNDMLHDDTFIERVLKVIFPTEDDLRLELRTVIDEFGNEEIMQITEAIRKKTQYWYR